MVISRYTLIKCLGIFVLNCIIVQSSAYLTGITSFSIPNTSNYNSINNSLTTPITIVIDPGHGGKDGGCSHSQHNEKQITLEFAQTLGKVLESKSEYLNIVFTRTSDDFVSLENRAQIANRLQADLFISVHANSLHDSTVSGFETYVFGNANTKKNELSHIENLIDWSNDSEQSDIPTLILGNMMKTALREKSISLAKEINNRLNEQSQIKNRGLKEAKFKVLKKAEMPSVLLEVGFLTNPKDYNLLKSSQGQSQLAEKIAIGIIDYLVQD